MWRGVCSLYTLVNWSLCPAVTYRLPWQLPTTRDICYRLRGTWCSCWSVDAHFFPLLIFIWISNVTIMTLTHFCLLYTSRYSWVESGMDLEDLNFTFMLISLFELFVFHLLRHTCMQYLAISLRLWVYSCIYFITCLCLWLMSAVSPVISGVQLLNLKSTRGLFTSPDGWVQVFSGYLNGGRVCMWICQ